MASQQCLEYIVCKRKDMFTPMFNSHANWSPASSVMYQMSSRPVCFTNLWHLAHLSLLCKFLLLIMYILVIYRFVLTVSTVPSALTCGVVTCMYQRYRSWLRRCNTVSNSTEVLVVHGDGGGSLYTVIQCMYLAPDTIPVYSACSSSVILFLLAILAVP